MVEERLLQKNDDGRKLLVARFAAHTMARSLISAAQRTHRAFTQCQLEAFPTLRYPYLPWTVDVIPDMVKGCMAQAAGRGDALTGATAR